MLVYLRSVCDPIKWYYPIYIYPFQISLNKLIYQIDENPVNKEELSSFTGNRVIPQQNWDDYTTVDWLITNSIKRKTSDLWQRTVVAVYLTFCLEVSCIFPLYTIRNYYQ